MVDPQADAKLRQDMWMLRGQELPLPPGGRAERVLRQLMDPPLRSGLLEHLPR
jgi:hypothetical protein